MARKVDPEVLAGFLEEAKSYLPRIVQGIQAFENHPSQGETLEEAHRHAHTIKGASSMVGLTGLSNMANHLEEALELLMTADRLPRPAEAAELLRQIVAQVGVYLEGKSSGSVRDKPLLDEVNRISRQLHGLPTEDRFSLPACEDTTTPTSEAGTIDPFM